ncbi:MAG: FixH family protein [Lewinellaceae bacterium]|nr:FixH family protein [Saprospiraceae bacterium]MCB9339976.1 FixH family protein [Lewinellaceae bacterium]
MKLNWGSGIAIFYSSFVIVMVAMVFYSKSFDSSLVVDNYYEQDLQYQQHINKLHNSQALPQDLTIKEDRQGKIVSLQFPQGFEKLGGEIQFYRADDKSKDFKLKVNVDEKGTQLVSAKNLLPGRWTVKVDWEGDGRLFYKEEVVVL